MQLSISAQHINKLGDSLQDHIRARTEEIIKKYVSDVVSVNIHFTKERSNHVCSILVISGISHQKLKSEDSCNEIYSSFDRAIIKLEKQLRKYKSKLKNHHKKPLAIKALGTKYIINPYASDIDIEQDYQETEEHNNPIIVAEQPVEIEHLNVSEAVMKMDLENLPALMFVNSKTDRVNIVYYRRDGNISWVDSKN